MTPIGQAREVVRWCRQLAKHSEARDGTTRRFLTPPMRDVHTALAAWMAQSGMAVRVDAIGNLRAVLPAETPSSSAPRLYIGSHLDTVPNAGAFDGVLGVVLAAALIGLVGSRRFPFSIEIIGFSDEEGVRFGVPFLGSRAFAGSFDASLLERTDESGKTLGDAIRAFGLDPRRIPDARAIDGALGYLEFHIEQGPALENLNLPAAAVDVISGQTRAQLTFAGRAGHAGTTPMRMRRDALACAAEWIVEVEREALATPDLVATVGQLAVEPGVGNVIPAEVALSLDVRHPSDEVRNRAVERLRTAASACGNRRGITTAYAPALDQPSVALDPALTSLVEKAIETTGHPPNRMPSGAGHDAMIVAQAMPAGMLFIRCGGGISHHPDEDVREEDVAVALEIGLNVLDSLESKRA